jgi:predicted phosphodiesterase
MWIGVISGTNGYLEESARDIFEGVDHILHCGNIGTTAILEQLSLVAPVTGVLGPLVDPDYFPLGKSLYNMCFDTGIFIRHDMGDPFDLSKELRADLERSKPEVVLFGSGGQSFRCRIENRLFFNPGNCGRPERGASRSIGLLEIEGQSVRGEVVPIDE